MEVKLHIVYILLLFFNTIILIYVLVLDCTIFTLFCICIFNVIWQLNALNGFSFQLLIYAISAITF